MQYVYGEMNQDIRKENNIANKVYEKYQNL